MTADDRSRRWVDRALTASVRAPLFTTPALLAALILAYGGTVALMLDRGRAGALWAIFGERGPRMLVRLGALTPAVWKGEPWRLITHQLLHADALHIAFNGLALWGLGRLAEPLFGASRTLWLFVLCGVGGGLLSALGPVERTVGASGALFGLMGALLSWGWRHRALLPEDLAAILRRRLPPLVALNLGIGLLLPFVDNRAHAGGLIAGLILGLVTGDQVIPGQQGPVWRRGLMLAGALGLLLWGVARVALGW